MLRYVVFLVLSCLVVYAVTVFFRLGGHLPVTFKPVASYEEIAVLYKDHIGPYHKINSIIEEVESWALSQNLPCTRTFGKYLDDPRSQDEARLRSQGGCVLDGIQSISLSQPLPEGVQMGRIESRPYLLAYFEGAPSISPFKVYPKAMDIIDDKQLVLDGAIYEIYSFQGDEKAKTEYLFPVKDQL